MKVRYPGPAIPPERRNQPEFSSAFGIPLPVGETIDVSDDAGEVMTACGQVERIEGGTPPPPPPEAPAPADDPAAERARAPEPEAATLSETTSQDPDQRASRRAGRNEKR